MGFRYCPFCKEDLSFKNYVYSCTNNHEIFINPAPCVSIIPIKDDKMLLSRRGIEPRIGTIDFIGGFVNVGETIKQAAIRETLEETGLTVKLEKYVGEYFEEYTEKIAYPLSFTYTASIIEGTLKAQDDVSELIWIPTKEIEHLDLTNSFPTMKLVFQDLLKIINITHT